MSDRPSYLVILPEFGLFSSHWVEIDAFNAARKLRSRGEKPMVIEVPETDGICVKWQMEIPEDAEASQDKPEKAKGK